MLQSRPVTTARRGGPWSPTERAGEPILHGLGVARESQPATPGSLTNIAEAAKLADGDVLVAQMTAPDWVPSCAGRPRS